MLFYCNQIDFVFPTGDEAKIKVTFTGTPPFSFMYSRSSPSGYEVHSASDIMEHEYIIRTGLEGSFRVTAVGDRFCSLESGK
jgi:nucleoporin POM152